MVEPNVTGSADGLAHPHPPAGGPGLHDRRRGADQTPGEANADRQSQQQQAGDAGIDGCRQIQPIDRHMEAD